MLVFLGLFDLAIFDRRRRRRKSSVLLDFEARTTTSIMTQDLEEIDYTGGRGWVE